MSTGGVDPRRPLLARDAGLRRVSRLTGWLAAGGLALTGLIAKMAAESFHGHTARAATSARSAGPAPSAASGSDPGSDSSGSSDDESSDPAAQDPGLAAPSQAPQPSSNSDGATSGGS